jgi:hypothetical protein
LFLFVVEEYVFRGVDIPQVLFDHLPAVEHLGRFQLGTITNNTAMNNHGQVFV